MLGYNQNAVIDHLNQYLQIKSRPLNLRHGYCHGFTLLWLYSMYTGKEAWYYQTLRNIVQANNPQEYAAIEADIEKFLSHIQWLQSSSEYAIGFNQLDIEKILEIPLQFSLSFLFQPKQLEAIIQQIIENENMVTVSGPNHTIGVYKRDDKYFIFDPNYREGHAVLLNTAQELRDELINCLFTRIGLQGERLPFTFKIMSNTKPNLSKENLYRTLLAQEENINILGTWGISNLYSSCESNNLDQIKILLQQGANPNVLTCSELSPLFIAACKGYGDIVQYLLQHGADINYVNCRQDTALSAASAIGHDNVVDILLKHGANPYRKVNDRTYFQLAIENKRFDCALTYLKHGYRLNKDEINLIAKYRADLQHVANMQWKSLNANEKYRVQKNLRKKSFFSRLNLFNRQYKNSDRMNDAMINNKVILK